MTPSGSQQGLADQVDHTELEEYYDQLEILKEIKGLGIY